MSSTELNTAASTAQDLQNSFHDITDQVYHTLAMFEQLSARLEARCTALDTNAPKKVETLRSGGTKEPDYRAIAPLMDDSSVNDILINGANQIYVERAGVLELTGHRFDSEDELIDFAKEVADYCGRVVDDKNPLVDARLPDGSRVNIVTPPVAIDGISVSIRKFGDGKLALSNMVEGNCMSEQMAEFLRCCAAASVNMVVSGGTGSGKTTLLNAICKHISPADRVVTIEDSAELQLPIPHVVRLESVTHEEAGRKMVTMRDLLKNALRMRPNRIIVGETRGGEAFDMIQAMNTGHEGSLTTIHANTPRDGISRIENMIGMADTNMPTTAVRKQIASAVHIIVQLERAHNGARHVTHISEVVGMEGDIITMQDIFTYKENKQMDGTSTPSYTWSGTFPRHTLLNEKLREKNVLKLQ